MAHRLAAKDGYDLARCGRCQHTFVMDPPPAEDLARHYEYARDPAAVPDFVFPILRGVVSGFDRVRCTGRLLDVGFGAGAMLRAASELGWEAHGIEIARSAIDAVRAAGIRAELAEGDFLTHPYEPGSFDVVIFDGIVANLRYPLTFFARAREVLRGGGLLYATTPNGRGLSALVLGAEWSACAPPEHLHLFSSRSIAVASRRSGFASTRTYTRGVNPYELLRRFGRGRTTPRGTAVNAALMRTGSGRLVKRAANAVLRATGLGDQLYLEANA
jgi:SAM-dependent methyltransferase